MDDKYFRLPQYAELLISAGLELETIMDVTKEELEELGITKIGHRKKILKYAAKLMATRNNQAAAQQHSDANSVSSHTYSPHAVNLNIWGDDSVQSVASSCNNIWSAHPNAY